MKYMSLLESIIYGFVSAIAEFLPVSSCAHQILIRYIFGFDTRDPIQDLLVHIGILLSVFVSFKEVIFRLNRSFKSPKRGKRRRHQTEGKNAYDLRLIKTASVPLILGLLLSFVTQAFEENLLYLLAFLTLNAVILFVADHSSHGNRDSRTMSALDGIFMGVLGSLSIFPGISRTGMIASYATMRGADSQNASTWAVLIGVPALFFAIFFDIYNVFSLGIAAITFTSIIGYLLAGAASFFGGYVGIALLQAVLNRSGFSGFAYYSLGAAFMSFLLYLLT